MSEEFKRGEWITLEYPGCKPFKVIVSDVEHSGTSVTYTAHRFPDDVFYYPTETAQQPVPTGYFPREWWESPLGEAIQDSLRQVIVNPPRSTAMGQWPCPTALLRALADTPPDR